MLRNIASSSDEASRKIDDRPAVVVGHRRLELPFDVLLGADDAGAEVMSFTFGKLTR